MSAQLFGQYVEKRVVVNLLNGSALAGRFHKYAGELIVLTDAAYLTDGQSPAPLEGEVMIPFRNVDFVQIPPAA